MGAFVSERENLRHSVHVDLMSASDDRLFRIFLSHYRFLQKTDDLCVKLRLTVTITRRTNLDQLRAEVANDSDCGNSLVI